MQRSLTPSGLAGPLIPTTAILVAPPAVAGVAWFQMNGGRVDAVALGLGGYAVLMILVQVRAITIFRTAPFGPGWWAFSFPYAAVIVDAMRWLSAERTAHAAQVSYLLLAVLSAAVLGLVWRTVVALVKGTFLPITPAVSPATVRRHENEQLDLR
jgi:tellurite resistance protein